MSAEVIILDEAINFIASLPVKLRSKTMRTIGLLETFGNELCEPYSKTLVNCKGLKELRIKFGSDICRLFYFHIGQKVYIIASGYRKKSRKTDSRQIKKALVIMDTILRENR